MRCEQVRDQLPDYSLGTLSETEGAGVGRHLRGCAACRREAATLDEGVTMFASSAAKEPPSELKDRVLTVLDEEWADAGRRASPGSGAPPNAWGRWSMSPRWIRPLAAAAAAVLLAGSLAWGGYSAITAGRLQEDAATYRTFLQALGGLDVRVVSLHPRAGVRLEGSAVLYDSDRGQSWVLVTVRTIGYGQPLTATLSGDNGRSIQMPFPLKLDSDGDGATWLVTSANIERLRTVTLRGPDHSLIAWGTTHIGHPS